MLATLTWGNIELAIRIVLGLATLTYTLLCIWDWAEKRRREKSNWNEASRREKSDWNDQRRARVQQFGTPTTQKDGIGKDNDAGSI